MTQVRRATTPARRVAALAGATALLGAGGIGLAGPAAAETEVERPDSFTSAYTVMATPDTIIDTEGQPAEGAPGASGTFDFMVNSDLEIICYDISVTGAEPPYESPAKTATHVHEAPAGETGPPRMSFPDPQGSGDTRTSSGCFQGPFTTGLEGDDGADTGEGFRLADLEADPTSYSADTHTAEYAAGAVRGQLRQVPVGGVDTGLGGMAEEQGTSTALLGASGAALAGVAVGSWLLVRRTRRVGVR